MSPRPERPGSGADLQTRIEALKEAHGLGEGVLPEAALQRAADVVERASARRALSAEHTVVGFFGATGSGKSSLFNAVTGTQLATAAARRPTTSRPLAGIWGEEGSAALLDWLQVADRHLVAEPDGTAGTAGRTAWFRRSPDEPGGLILLDLPDFDSTALEHRRVVERMTGQVDVLVWVLDPQKYADAAVHQGFLKPLATHGAVTVVVLNQTDRLPESQVRPVLDSLRGILASDGLAKVPVLAASAATGQGVPELRAAVTAVAAERRAVNRRLLADLSAAAAALEEASNGEDAPAGGGPDGGRHGAGRPAALPNSAKGAGRDDERRLADQLAQAAGVEIVASAVRKSYRRTATAKAGWPVTRWLGKLRPDPLRRLNLKSQDVNPSVNRTSLPPPGPAQRAQADSAVRTFAEAAAQGAPGPWRAAIRRAARSEADTLPDELDQAIAHTDIGANRGSWWWPVVGMLQWLALASAVAGLLWLTGLFVLAYLQFPVPPAPKVEGIPVPTLLVLAGVALGILLGITTGVVARFAAARRAAKARRRLRAAVAEVANRFVVQPVEAELDRYHRFIAALHRAGR